MRLFEEKTENFNASKYMNLVTLALATPLPSSLLSSPLELNFCPNFLISFEIQIKTSSVFLYFSICSVQEFKLKKFPKKIFFFFRGGLSPRAESCLELLFVKMTFVYTQTRNESRFYYCMGFLLIRHDTRVLLYG